MKLTLNAAKIFKEIEQDVADLKASDAVRDKKIVHLANNVFLVRENKLWKSRISKKTRKTYASFGNWLGAEVLESRSSVYRFLSARKYLTSVPNETLEKIGNSKCFELARLGREKPELLPRFLKEVVKRPEIQVVSLHNMVENSIAGGKFDSGQYESIQFTVKVEDLDVIHKALAVIQAQEAVDNPSTASGRGVHLVSICQEFLSGDDERKILANLKEAGAFDKLGDFKIEDD